MLEEFTTHAGQAVPDADGRIAPNINCVRHSLTYVIQSSATNGLRGP